MIIPRYFILAFILFALGSLSGLNVSASVNGTEDEVPKIAIIGAGPAGLAAADRLLKTIDHRQPFEIHLYDQADRIGGKVRSLKTAEDKILELGALEVGCDYSDILKYCQEFNLTLEPLGETMVLDPQNFKQSLSLKDYMLQHTQFSRYGVVNKLKLLWDMTRLTARAWYYRDASHYGRAALEAHPELYHNVYQTLVTAKLDALLPLFTTLFCHYGYGPLNGLAEVDALQFLNWYLLLRITVNMVWPSPNLVWTIKEGYETLWQRVRERLERSGKVFIHLNHQCSTIDHWSTAVPAHNPGVSLVFLINNPETHTPTDLTAKNFNYLIAACPLNDIYYKKDHHLIPQNILRMDTYKYGTRIVKLAQNCGRRFYVMPEYTKDSPCGFYQPDPDDPTCVVYGYGDSLQEERVHCFFHRLGIKVESCGQLLLVNYYPHHRNSANYEEMLALQDEVMQFAGAGPYFETVKQATASGFAAADKIARLINQKFT